MFCRETSVDDTRMLEGSAGVCIEAPQLVRIARSTITQLKQSCTSVYRAVPSANIMRTGRGQQTLKVLVQGSWTGQTDKGDCQPSIRF